MGRGRALWFGILGMLLVGTAASATALPRPTVPYVADVTMDMSGHGSGHQKMEVKGKVYMDGDMERRETSVMGRTSVVITRRDKNVTWVLMPERSVYVEHPIGGKYDDPYASWNKAGVTLTKVGEEKLNGVEATKYRAEAKASDGHMDTGFVWLTKENIPVRLEANVKGQESKLVVNYTNIKTGKQDASLFEVPTGYHKMDMSQMGGMPHGMPPAGKLTEEQKQKLQQEMQQQMQDMMKQAPKSPPAGK